VRLIAPSVTLTTTGHPIHPDLRVDFRRFSEPIVIEDKVWIGSNAVVLPGVHIGFGAVIGAGSVVTHDIPAMTVAVGVPCRVLRHITDEDLHTPHSPHPGANTHIAPFCRTQPATTDSPRPRQVSDAALLAADPEAVVAFFTALSGCGDGGRFRAIIARPPRGSGAVRALRAVPVQ
jgi:hypothetical protein